MKFKYDNLNDILIKQNASQPTKPAYILLQDGEVESSRLSFGQLFDLARSYAAELQTHLKAGDRALLLLPEESDFLPIFWACLCAGIYAIPSPAYSVKMVTRMLPRLATILKNAETQCIITSREVSSGIAEVLGDKAKQFKFINVEDLAKTAAAFWIVPQLNKNSIAFIQYTSGSTSEPKGVVVSHGNLLHNFEMLDRHVSTYDSDRSRSVCITWLPLFHDMGLIATALRPVYSGDTSVVMKPLDFLKKPVRWLKAFSNYKGTFTIAPNFSYEICYRKITDEEMIDVNLSSWKIGVNGAEPVRLSTMRNFENRFAKWGLQPVLSGGYGLAENTLCGGFTNKGEQKTLFVTQDSVAGEGRLEIVEESHANAYGIMSSGSFTGQVNKIVDPETHRELPDLTVGEIWISGDSVAKGYWKNEAATQEIFRAKIAGDTRDYLRTGDLGFIQNGTMFITGRLKDLIIVRGKNHYPQDIELTAESAHPSVRSGCAAAFFVEVDGEEKVVIVAEAKIAATEESAALIAAIRSTVLAQHEIPLYEVALIPPGSAFKTSSGKIQRALTKKTWLKNQARRSA